MQQLPVRKYVTFKLYGDLFPKCEEEDGGRNSQKISANIWRKVY